MLRRSFFAILLGVLVGGAVVALPGVSEAIRGGVGAIFGRQAADPEPRSIARAESKPATPETEDNQNEVRLTADQIKLIGLKTAVAKRMPLVIELFLNGEVSANLDRTAQILPRIPGVVREIPKTLGDRVRANEPVAVIESRELAEAEATYLAAKSKAQLADQQRDREETLYKKKITAEQDYLAAKQAAETANIELRAAEQKLALLGLDPKQAKPRPAGSATPARVSIVAPFDGTLIEKRVAVGDQVTDQTPLFRIANLDEVWVLANVFEKDIGRVRVGQSASVTLRSYPDRAFEGKVTWVSEVLDEKTRTLKVRIELDNRERLLKPGSFARVRLKTVGDENAIVVPAAAIQRQKSESIVFVDAGGGLYKRREIKVGARSPDAVEIADGLQAGEVVVTSGSFMLKSELEKSGFADKD